MIIYLMFLSPNLMTPQISTFDSPLYPYHPPGCLAHKGKEGRKERREREEEETEGREEPGGEGEKDKKKEGGREDLTNKLITKRDRKYNLY